MKPTCTRSAGCRMRDPEDYDPDPYPDEGGKTGYCACCGKECTATVIDEGIGHYEYWGAKGVDIRLSEVSDCCEAEVLDEPPEEEEA
jgi:hypothetical protein